MECGRGALDVHVRALEGFPDESDRGFGFADPLSAIVELVVRLTSPNDVAEDAHFLCLRRSLADFVHLETRLQAEGESFESDEHAIGIARLIERHTAALDRPRFGSIASETERLVVQLEMRLNSMLLRSPSRRSAALKQFFGYEAVDAKKGQQVVEKCLGPNDAMEEEAIVGGERVAHPVDVHGGSIIMWKFAFAGDAVDFSAVYTPNEEDENSTEAKEKVGDAEEVDPYSEAAWKASNTASPEQTPRERFVLQYSTRYLGQAEEQDTWIYGACRVPCDARGVVTLEWVDAGEASIFAKPLRFQTRVCQANDNDNGGVTLQDEWTVINGVEDDAEEADDSLAWLEALVESSSVTSWPTMTIDQVAPLDSNNLHHHTDGTLANDTTRVKDIKIVELKSKVFQLEEELLAVRQELKTTKSELEISSEIYKASLETIAHLETAPPRLGGGAPSHRASLDDVAPRDSLGSIDEGDEEEEDDDDSYGENDAGLETDEDDSEATADKETRHLRDLVATFQEQCLWRSIETSESEKRNLVLEAELNQLDRDKQSLTDQLAAKDHELAALVTETQKLKAQKSVLVKEVKRLQPYTQVNLSALIREAEEARMMQRSLQAQLQVLLAATTPETEHPIAQAATENGD